MNKRKIEETETLPEVATTITTISCLETSLYNSLEFSVTSDNKNFVALQDCTDPSKSISDYIGNLDLVDICTIAIEYGAERELQRKKLYRDLMLKIGELLKQKVNVLITYEDWYKCFNVVFTNVLVGKLKQCSNYQRGITVLGGFRSKFMDQKKDQAVLTDFYNKTKKNASEDVKDIMKVLHLVLKDISTPESLEHDSLHLVCREDYSSFYTASSKEGAEFRDFVIQTISNCSYNKDSNIQSQNFKQLMNVTAAETMLLDINHKNYRESQLTVRSWWII
jgi:hypothetical protein